MCMMRQVQFTEDEKAVSELLAGGVAALKHKEMQSFLDAFPDPGAFFAALVCTFGPPKALISEEDAAHLLRKYKAKGDDSALRFYVAECYYAIHASGIPTLPSYAVPEPAAAAREQSYATILDTIEKTRTKLWESVCTRDKQERNKLDDLLLDLRKQANACFPGEGQFLFGSAMQDTPCYVIPDRENAGPNAREIGDNAFPSTVLLSFKTDVDFRASSSRAKGGGVRATRSAKPASGAAGDVGHDDEIYCVPRLQVVPMLNHGNGVQSFTMYGPGAITTTRACLPELLHTAQQLDAALEAKAEKPEHVQALGVTMRQIDACEALYREMDRLGEDWKTLLLLLLPPECLAMVDDSMLDVLREGQADSIVVKMMPPGTNVSCGISYVAVHVGTELAPPGVAIPNTDMHPGDRVCPDEVSGVNIHVCFLGPPGFIAQGELGGTFVQCEADMHALVEPTLGERFEELSALGASRTTSNPVTGTMRATVPVVLTPAMTLEQTALRTTKLFSGPKGHSMLTLGKVVCQKKYANVVRNANGKIPNQSFQLKLCPVAGRPNIGTRPLFCELAPTEDDTFLNLRVFDHHGAPTLYRCTCQTEFTVERATARSDALHRIVSLEPEEEQHSRCFFGVGADGKVKNMRIVPQEGDSECFHLDNLAALRKLLLHPQKTEFLGDGTMKAGLEGLRAALGERAIGDLLYIGIFKISTKEPEIIVTKHEDNDDEVGECVDMSQARVGMCEKTLCVALQVPEDMLIKTTIKAGDSAIGLEFKYLTSTGEKECTCMFMSLKPEEHHQFHISLQKDNAEDMDGWEVKIKNDSSLRIFFTVRGTVLKANHWGKNCCFTEAWADTAGGASSMISALDVQERPDAAADAAEELQPRQEQTDVGNVDAEAVGARPGEKRKR